MPKKKFIQVAGNPRYEKAVAPQYGTSTNPKSFVTNPETGTCDFGYFPGAVDGQTQREFPAGPIRLRHGEHIGPHRGYGLVHMCYERCPGVIFDDAKQSMLGLIAAVLLAGAEIFYEGGNGSSANRVAVLKSKAGVVILEERQDGRNETIYSIVTAYRAKTAHGTRIGFFSMPGKANGPKEGPSIVESEVVPQPLLSAPLPAGSEE